eukprot:14930833-Alexandrium_andersonii.AAC.1
MSASLVGSEMCIRDRSRAEAALRQQPRARPHARPATERQPRCFLRRPACLLYTSDAADDM